MLVLEANYKELCFENVLDCDYCYQNKLAVTRNNKYVLSVVSELPLFWNLHFWDLKTQVFFICLMLVLISSAYLSHIRHLHPKKRKRKKVLSKSMSIFRQTGFPLLS
jgi:hypothetical protein